MGFSVINNKVEVGLYLFWPSGGTVRRLRGQVGQRGYFTQRVEVMIPGVNRSGIVCEKTVSAVRYT